MNTMNTMNTVNLLNNEIITTTGIQSIPENIEIKPGDMIAAHGINTVIQKIYYAEYYTYTARRTGITTVIIDVEYIDMIGQYHHYKSQYDKGRYHSTEYDILFTFD